jgi:dienelactone hydrolase
MHHIARRAGPGHEVGSAGVPFWITMRPFPLAFLVAWLAAAVAFAPPAQAQRELAQSESTGVRGTLGRDAVSPRDPPRQEDSPGPQGNEEGPSRRQLWLIPGPRNVTLMRTQVFRPQGEGPFPLVVINHGSWEDPSRRVDLKDPSFGPATEWFLQRGYAVAVPQRPGHGQTGGPYLETQGSCDNADYHRAGLGAADGIAAAVSYLRSQPFVRGEGIVIVGQSAGGWGALALASRNPSAVKAIINIAGGRGGRSYDRAHNNCAPQRLTQAAERYGRTARLPTLWIYTENDTFFGPTLSRQMADAYRKAGGVIELHLLRPFGDEGHNLFPSPAGVKVWGPIVENFLANLK